MEASCNGAAVETDGLETGDVAEDGEDESDKGDVVALFEEMQGLGKEHVTHDIECGACEEKRYIVSTRKGQECFLSLTVEQFDHIRGNIVGSMLIKPRSESITPSLESRLIALQTRITKSRSHSFSHPKTIRIIIPKRTMNLIQRRIVKDQVLRKCRNAIGFAFINRLPRLRVSRDSNQIRCEAYHRAIFLVEFDDGYRFVACPHGFQVW